MAKFKYETVTPFGTFTRESDREYTHIVIIEFTNDDNTTSHGAPFYCGRFDLAQKKAATEVSQWTKWISEANEGNYNRYNHTTARSHIFPVGLKQPKAPKAPAPAPEAKEEPTGKPEATPTSLVGYVYITCCDCGDSRMIKVQDVFQVKRCIECQGKHVKARRSEKMKAKRAAKKQ